jgi:hypothetical protein
VKIICDFEIQLVVGNEELTSLFCKFILKINVNYLFLKKKKKKKKD